MIFRHAATLRAMYEDQIPSAEPRRSCFGCADIDSVLKTLLVSAPPVNVPSTTSLSPLTRRRTQTTTTKYAKPLNTRRKLYAIPDAVSWRSRRLAVHDALAFQHIERFPQLCIVLE